MRPYARQWTETLLSLLNADLAWLRRLQLGQREGQDSVLKFGRGLLRIDREGEAEGS